jgi:hypothetical protein
MSAVKVSFRESNGRSRNRVMVVAAFGLLVTTFTSMTLPAGAAKTPQSAFTKPAPATKPLPIDGTSVSFDDNRATFSFTANRNDWFASDSSVDLGIVGSLNFSESIGKNEIFQLPQTGTYKLVIGGASASGLVSIRRLDPPKVTKAEVGTPASLILQGDRPEYALVSLRGGLRYELSSNQTFGQLCVSQHEGFNVPASRLVESDSPLNFSRNQRPKVPTAAQSNGPLNTERFGQCLEANTTRTLVALHDETLTISLSKTSADLDQPATLLVKEIANDKVLSLDEKSSARAKSEPNARTLISR